VSGFVPSAFFPANGGGGLPVPELDAPTYTPSAGDYVVGGYHDFDGVDEYIDFGRITACEVTTGSTWSISCWADAVGNENRFFRIFNATNTNNLTVLEYNNRDLWISYSLGGQQFLPQYNGKLPTSGWFHVLATTDGSSIRAFVNGTEVTTRFVTGTYPTATETWDATTKVVIGGNPGSLFHQGGLAEVAM